MFRVTEEGWTWVPELTEEQRAQYRERMKHAELGVLVDPGYLAYAQPGETDWQQGVGLVRVKED